MSINSVILLEHKPLPLDSNERIIFDDPRVSVLIESGSGYPGSSSQYENDLGALYLTTKRLIYVCESPCPSFISFLLTYDLIKHIEKDFNFFIFGSNSVKILFTPVRDQGILNELATVTFKLKDGNVSTFYAMLKEQRRLNAQGSERSEPLPLYQPPRECPQYGSNNSLN